MPIPNKQSGPEGLPTGKGLPLPPRPGTSLPQRPQPQGGLPGVPQQRPQQGGLPLPPQRQSRPVEQEPAAPLPQPSLPPERSRSHLSEYNYEANRMPQAPQQPAYEPSFETDDAFSPIAPEEQDSWDRSEYDAPVRREEPLSQRASRREAPRRSATQDLFIEEEEPAPKARPVASSPAKADRRRRKDKKGQDVFVNEASGELEPFGGKRKLKVPELDSRKNLRQRAQMVQFIALGLLGVIALAGLFNAVVPKPTLSEAEVAAIVQESIGASSFPLEEGKGFAQDFIQAYLSVNSDNFSDGLLGYYYSGKFGPVQLPNRTYESSLQQTLLYGPTVYEARALTEASASYTIGAVVLTSSSRAEGQTVPQQVFFNVNVYHDAEAGSFLITKDSPTLVPAPESAGVNSQPDGAPLGTGSADQNLTTAVRSVVLGFMRGYATSSPSSHSALDQYIVPGADSSLATGMNGNVQFAGDPETSITFTAYPGTVANEVKVAVTVPWVNAIGSDTAATRIEYRSQYVMTLEKQANGQYLVSKFAPQLFAPKDA